jgi:hypothetical protein
MTEPDSRPPAAKSDEKHAVPTVEDHDHDHNAVNRTDRALKYERQMRILEGLLFWRKAILFSFVISLAVIMEGYDTSLSMYTLEPEPYPTPSGKSPAS